MLFILVDYFQYQNLHFDFLSFFIFYAQLILNVIVEKQKNEEKLLWICPCLKNKISKKYCCILITQLMVSKKKLSISRVFEFVFLELDDFYPTILSYFIILHILHYYLHRGWVITPISIGKETTSLYFMNTYLVKYTFIYT